MIYKNRKEISAIFIDGRAVTTLHKGAELVWEAVRSCFGKGFWFNDKPWKNDNGWRNK